MSHVTFMRGTVFSPTQQAMFGKTGVPDADHSHQKNRYYYVSGMSDKQVRSSKVAKKEFSQLQLNPMVQPQPSTAPGAVLDPALNHLRSLPPSSISYNSKLIHAKI
eukprot:PhF_6_TR25029/c0_g1_i2/m.34402